MSQVFKLCRRLRTTHSFESFETWKTVRAVRHEDQDWESLIYTIKTRPKKAKGTNLAYGSMKAPSFVLQGAKVCYQ